MTNSMAGERGTELALSGSMNLVDVNMDAHLVLSRAGASKPVQRVRPRSSSGSRDLSRAEAKHRCRQLRQLARVARRRAGVEEVGILGESQQGSPPAEQHTERPGVDKKQRPSDAAGSTAGPDVSAPPCRRRNVPRPKPSASELTQPAAPPSRLASRDASQFFLGCSDPGDPDCSDGNA